MLVLLRSRSDCWNLSPLSADPSGKLDVLGHDGDPLGVDGAEIGVLKEPDEIGLCCLLDSHDGGTLEPKVGLEVLGDFPHKTLEGKLPDEKLGGLLVSPDLPEGDCARPESVRLLDSSSGRGGLPGGLGGELLPWSLSSGGLASGLLGSSHTGSSNLTDNLMKIGAVLILSRISARGRLNFSVSVGRGLLFWSDICTAL